VSTLPVPEFKDPVFAKRSPRCSFSMTENPRFGLVLAKTGSINSGTVVDLPLVWLTTVVHLENLKQKSNWRFKEIVKCQDDS
jgi:hypothetical protein